MSQQIHPEEALDAFRKRHGELADENVLLRALTTSLQRRVAELEEENSTLRGQLEQPQPMAAPAAG